MIILVSLGVCLTYAAVCTLGVLGAYVESECEEKLKKM